MLNDALIYFNESETIKNMFLKIKQKDRTEFKSFILDILIDNPEKLIKAYQGGWIDFYIWRIISNQYFSNTSPWFRKYLIKDLPMIDVANEEPDESIDTEKIIDDVKLIMRRMHWYNRTLFEMYYFQKMTYQQIEKATGINYMSIRRTVMKSLGDVKKQLKIKKDDL